MNFSFHVKTKIFFGSNCLQDNCYRLAQYGEKAIIITGKTSGKKSGALPAIECMLRELGINYSVYNNVESNPSLEHVICGVKQAKEFGANFVIGIGGGSSLDVAKAIAVLVNNNIDPVELYNNSFTNKPLPIIAIPTTAGSGSEVTPYAVLTLKDLQTKKSFGTEDTIPQMAFLDPAYTESLPIDITINTAIDAFSHAVEGYLSKKSTMFSDMFALKSIDIFSECLSCLIEKNVDSIIREKLLYMSLLSGICISQAGTTSLHNMGYPLTYFKNIPHGKATGLFLCEYLRFVYDSASDKINNILDHLKVNDVNSLKKIMYDLFSYDVCLTTAEMKFYSAQTMKQKSILSNPQELNESDFIKIMKRSIQH